MTLTRAFPVRPALAMLLSLAACSEPSSNEVVYNRLTTGLSTQPVCSSQARIESIPNGARILIEEASIFAAGLADLTECGQYTLASVSEGLLDLRIMQLAIEPSADTGVQASSMTTPLSQQRANTVAKWFSEFAPLSTLGPVAVLNPATPQSPELLGILVQVRELREASR